MENGVALGERWSKVFTVGPVGEYPDMTRYALPTMCQQCENAPCVSVCPTGASYRDGNNVVLVDKEKCIGCKYCMMACPYGVRSWNAAEKCAEKCTLCGHLTSSMAIWTTLTPTPPRSWPSIPKATSTPCRTWATTLRPVTS